VTATPFQVSVYDEASRVVYSGDFDGPVEFGRLASADDRPGAARRLAAEGRWRLVIACRGADCVARRHALLEPLAGGQFRLTNINALVPFRLGDGSLVEPSRSREVVPPMSFLLGRTTVSLQSARGEGPRVAAAGAPAG
jgi:hypothetical protein